MEQKYPSTNPFDLFDLTTDLFVLANRREEEKKDESQSNTPDAN